MIPNKTYFIMCPSHLLTHRNLFTHHVFTALCAVPRAGISNYNVTCYNNGYTHEKNHPDKGTNRICLCFV